MPNSVNDNMAADWSPLIVHQPPGLLKPATRNTRTHTRAQIAQLMASISHFGFTAPVMVDRANAIVAGHARVEAAVQLGLATVPTISLTHLSREELRYYAIADNKLALNAGWDEGLLRIELGELAEMNLSFEIDMTGFSTPEIDLLEGKVSKAEAEVDASADRMPAVWSVTQRDDVWTLGKHRLLCGDSRDEVSFAVVMGEDKARMVLSDPPYNVEVDGHVGGLGKIRHAEFAMASGEMTSLEFTQMLRQVFANEAAYSVDGALHYQFMDWRHMGEMMEAGSTVYSELKNRCVWVKDNAGMGSLYRSQCEDVYVWKVGTATHINNVELGKNGRYRTNAWNYRGAIKTGRKSELALHPTVKPVAMLMDAIKDVTNRGDIVLDAFGGSGSTLLAAEKTRRRARLIEFEPGYCDVTIGRWQEMTGKDAILEETGETFAQVSLRRREEFERMVDAALDEEAA